MICKVYIFWKVIQYTIHWDKTQMLKTYPSDKINVTKNYFLSQTPTHHSFTLNSQFLYELKHKVHLSKSVGGGDFPFSIPSRYTFYFYISLYWTKNFFLRKIGIDKREGVDEKRYKKWHKKEGVQPQKVISLTQILLYTFICNSIFPSWVLIKLW